jgi:hypothetical protein
MRGLTKLGDRSREERSPDPSSRGEGTRGRLDNPRPTERRIRLTLDLSREQHRFIRRFALEEDTDASSVLRTLLALLEEDATLVERILGRLERKYAS